MTGRRRGPLQALSKRAVALYVGLAVAQGISLVLIADALATSIAAISDGTDAWRGAVALGAVGVVIRAAATWLSRMHGARTAAATKARLRVDLAAAALRGSADDRGAIAVLAGPGLDDLDDYFTTGLPAIVASAVVPIVILARLAFADWLSILIVSVTLPLIPVFMILIGQHSRERIDRANSVLARLAHHLVELAEGLPVLVGLGQIRRQTAALSAIQDDYRRRTLLTLRTAFLSSLALELIATISVAVLAVTLGVRLLSGAIGLDVALLVLIVAPEAYNALRELGAAYHATQRGRSALDSTALATRSVRQTRAIPDSDRIELDDLTVVDAQGCVLVGPISFQLGVGEVVAVTGASGAGKSTILSAINGTLAPLLRVTGQQRGPRRTASLPQAVRAVGELVLDELALYGDDAAARGILDELGIRGLLHARMTDLSPGELRRVGLARALLAVDVGATVLTLDEPTAHLDAEAADLAVSAIWRRRDRAAIVLVSHDRRLTARADREVAVVAQRRAVRIVDAVAEAVLPSHQPGEPGSPSAEQSGRAGWRWVLAILLGTTAGAFGIALTAVSGWLIVRAAEQPAIMYLSVAIVGVRFFGLGRSAARYGERLTLHDAAFRAADRLRLRTWERIAGRAAGSRRLQEGGAALDYVVVTVNLIRDLSPRVIGPLAGAGLTLVAVVVALMVVSPAVAVPVAAIILAGTLSASVVSLAVGSATRSAQVSSRSAVSRRMVALASAGPDLIGNGRDGAALDDSGRIIELAYRADVRSATNTGLAAGVTVLAVAGSALLAVILAASFGVSASTAAILALTSYAALDAAQQVVAAAPRLRELRAARRRLGPILGFVSADHGGSEIERVSRIELDNVTVRWPGADEPAFAGATGTVQAGRWLHIDGPSGSGKSTLLTTLMGGLVPEDGCFWIDGTDAADLDSDSLRRRVAWVPQDAHVFDSTVRGNLLLARRAEPITDDDLWLVLSVVGLDSRARRDQGGLDLAVGSGGGQLSGGERQRLAVARALLTGADVLLLDEPTAHLDDPSADELISDLRTRLRDRAVVLVSHRPGDRRDQDAHLVLGADRAELDAAPEFAGVA